MNSPKKRIEAKDIAEALNRSPDYRSEIGNAWLISDELIFVNYDVNTEITLEKAIKDKDTIFADIKSKENWAMIVDITNVGIITKTARDHYAGIQAVYPN